jgi:hypothetical protein
MVPTLNIDKMQLKDNGFLNGYIRDERREVQYQDCIYLLFKPNDLDKFKVFLDKEYERTKSVIDDYDYENGYVVVVYQLDPKFKKDFLLVMEGQYSKTSSAFQTLFPKIIKVKANGFSKDEISLQYRVFNKTQDLVKFWEDKFDVEFDDDQEVWHAFIVEDESLNLDKIKESCMTTK